MIRIFILFITLFTSLLLKAQDIAIGEWKEHLNYKHAISVSEGNGKTYCATTSGIFILNKSDNSMQRMSKVNGLSDVEASVLNFNKSNNKLLIAYKNSNMDIVQSDGRIVNIADIKRKPIIGNKTIYSIYFINQYAYLSCGFGIVVLDMDRNEIKDTYYIGAAGSTVIIRDITSDGTNMYAASEGGIYKASLSNPNLANYLAWTKFTTGAAGLPVGVYNTITSFNGNIYANFSKYQTNGALSQDSIFVNDGSSSTWTHFIVPSGYIVHSLRNFNNNLMEITDGFIDVYNSSLVLTQHLFQYLGDVCYTKQAVIDSDGKFWIADTRYGLVKANDNYSSWNYYLNGPASTNVKSLVSFEDKIWVAPGGVDDAWSNNYQTEGVSHFSNDTWETIRGNYSGIVNTDTLFDLLYLAIDSTNSNKVFASSWWNGVLEITNSVPTKLYNPTNSSLQVYTAAPTICKTAGLAFDSNNNLWICNPLNPKCIAFKRQNNTWGNFDMATILGNSPYLGQLLVDKNNQKWVVLTRGGGLFVTNINTDDNSTLPVPTSRGKKLTTATGNGKLPSSGVYCIAEDMDGEIWIGTDKGIAVFYSPENVFVSGANFDAQQILLEQDGHVQILLETELVQAIAVDDANRKWIATVNSGVFLMSADGTTQIHHFDENNSPLFSNDVKSITINHKTGEVYFGTSKGIISYRGTAIAGNESFTDVYAFPNPVVHDYTGPIAIKGLIDNTTLKITDISGSFVFETKSEGGQAIWDGKNFNGDRVSSGVYMVFCTNEDGSKKAVTKILVIN